MSSKSTTSSTSPTSDQSSATSIAIEQSSANPPPLPTPHPAQSSENFASALNALSTTFVIATPILLILPPRKLDLYTFSLSTAFVVSANHLLITQTGRGVWQRLDRKKKRVLEDTRHEEYASPTEKVPEFQGHFQRENKPIKSWEILGADGKAIAKESAIVAAAREAAAARQAVDAAKTEWEDEVEEEAAGVKGMLKKLWMGDETDGWQARRMQEEREKLAAGETYLDLIMDYIWEIWEKKKVREGVVEKEKDE